jgi:hypothetical protein
MVSTFTAAALLAAAALGTYFWQLAAWKSQQAQDLPPYDADFYRRRHQRRWQISAMLGAVALALIIGWFITSPLIVGFYWLGVLALLMWIILLAAADASASHVHFGRLRNRQAAEHAALQRELLEHTRKNSASPE